MYKNIVTVTLNPSIDVTLLADGLDFDRVNRVMEEIREMGGKGINVSRVVKAFGLETMCLCFTGQENADELAHYMERENLRYEFIKVEGAVRENLMLRCVGCGEDNPMSIKLNRKGPAISVMMTSAFMALLTHHVGEGDIVLFGGSLPENMKTSDFVDLILAVKNNGAKVALDTDCLTLEDYRLIKPWLIKPNIHELKDILPVEPDGVGGVIAAATTLRDAGVENVLVSMGGDGLVCVNAEGVTCAAVPQVQVKSTVGAGDSTVAGFIVGVKKGYPLEKCVRLAASCGTATAMREGTRLATKKMALDLLDQVVITE